MAFALLGICVLGATYIFCFDDVYVWLFHLLSNCDEYWDIIQIKFRFLLYGVFINIVIYTLEIHIYYGCKCDNRSILYVDHRPHNVVCIQCIDVQ